MAAAEMTAPVADWAPGEPVPEWDSLIFDEIGDLIGDHELQLDLENETFENSFCELDFDLDLMSWDSDPRDISKQTSTDYKVEPLSPATSADSVPSPLSVDSPVQHVPEDIDLGSSSQSSPVSLYGKDFPSLSLYTEQKEKKPLPKSKQCSANRSSATPSRGHSRVFKPLIQPKPLLPAFRKSQGPLSVQTKAIVIPAFPTLVTLPKQQPAVAIQPALPKGQPVVLSHSVAAHLQTPGILSPTNPTISITGELASLPGHTVNILPQITGKSLSNSNTAEAKTTLHATSENIGMNINVLKKQQRMIKNRESACQSRRKKKEYLLSLEARLNAALLENNHLKRENGSLKRQLEELAEENQNLKSPSPKRRALCVLMLLVFVVWNHDKLRVLEWAPASDELHTNSAHQSRHLLEFSGGAPQQKDARGIDRLKHSVSDNKALMVLTEEPILYISPKPCKPWINRTESLRLSHELRGWVHRHEAERSRSRKMSKDLEQKAQTVQNPSGKIANSELMALPYTGGSVGNSGNELQVYYTPLRNSQDFFDAIHRRGDTFYVVSFRRDHLLLPATTHNKTRRPKMSIVLPAINISEKIINDQGYEVMMQIDCEVMDTRILHIKNSSIPPYLREQQRNHTSLYSSPATVPKAAPVMRV
ncbi:cyclic AMP-dependent transcription factor ATF-6 alpha [Anolis carolinensis]|uniref:cyclic AMP-dependent transcription factor ATF-6 alpha n=1 Tax=Anolis carolinensis TaxID=28377 RepID=UPI002F2B1978